MTTLERLEIVQKMVQSLMDKNQRLGTPEERNEAGFGELYEAQQQLKWALQELSFLYDKA